jgi:hypothetical protein
VFKKLNSNRTNNPINKWAPELNSSQKKYKWLINEAIFNILSHKGNGNQNYTKARHQ